MDEMSLRIREHMALIEHTAKRLTYRFRNCLEPSEVFACTLMGAWRSLQKQDAGNEHPFAGILWYTALTQCDNLFDWYKSKNRYVSFIDDDLRTEDVDSPELLLEAQQVHDHLECMGPPIGGLQPEVCAGLGISRATACIKLKEAKLALGYDVGGANTRYTEEQKREILNYLGIPTDTRVNPSNPIERLGDTLPVYQSSSAAAGAF